MSMTPPPRFPVGLGLLVLCCLLPGLASSETLSIFYDRSIPQLQFAAGDLRTAATGKG